jgi:hypothetical protein
MSGRISFRFDVLPIRNRIIREDWCATRRPAGAGANQVWACNQPQDRQGGRPRPPAVGARPRRRGDRIEMLFAAGHESAHGILSGRNPAGLGP